MPCAGQNTALYSKEGSHSLPLIATLLDGRAEALGPLRFYSYFGVKADCLK